MYGAPAGPRLSLNSLLPLCCTINIYNHLISLSSSFINREFLQNHLYRQALIWLFGIICISAGRGRGPRSVSPAEVSGTEASGLAREILKPPSREQGWEKEGLALLPPSPRRSKTTQGHRTFFLGLSPPALLQVQLADQLSALLQKLIIDVGRVRAP